MARRILVIDDEPDILRVLKVALEFRGDYQVFLADTAAVGLTLAQQLHPDLILLDILMPEMTGFEVLERLRQNPQTARIPVVFLTARAQKREIQEGLQQDVLGYITKPFEALQLPEILEQMLQLADSGPPEDDSEPTASEASADSSDSPFQSGSST